MIGEVAERSDAKFDAKLAKMMKTMQPFYMQPITGSIKIMLQFLVFSFGGIRFEPEKEEWTCFDYLKKAGGLIAPFCVLALGLNGLHADIQRISELGMSAGSIVVVMVTSSNYLGAVGLFSLGPARIFGVNPFLIRCNFPQLVELLYWSIMFIYTVPMWILSVFVGMLCCNCALFCSLLKVALCFEFVLIFLLVMAFFSSWARERLVMYFYYFGSDIYLISILFLGVVCAAIAARTYGCLTGASTEAVKLAFAGNANEQELAEIANLRPLQSRLPDDSSDEEPESLKNVQGPAVKKNMNHLDLEKHVRPAGHHPKGYSRLHEEDNNPEANQGNEDGPPVSPDQAAQALKMLIVWSSCFYLSFAVYLEMIAITAVRRAHSYSFHELVQSLKQTLEERHALEYFQVLLQTAEATAQQTWSELVDRYWNLV